MELLTVYKLNGPAVAGIICPTHDKVDIDRQVYMEQLKRPWQPWHCPICGDHAEFDDHRYEEINL